MAPALTLANLDYPMFSGFEAPETSRTYGGDTPREDDLTTMGARLGRLAASGADSSGWYDRTDLNDTGDAETPDDPGFLRGDGDRWIGGEDVGQPRQPFDANDEAEPGNYEFHQGDRMSTDPATRVADSDYFPSAREAANRSIRGETGAFRRIGQSYVSTGIPDDLPNSDYRSARPRVAKRAHTGADTWLARRRTAKSASALGTGFFANVVTQAGTNGFTYIDTPETE